jgi:hypothetical protein
MLATAAFIGGAGIMAAASVVAFLAAPAASAQPQSRCATSVLTTTCASSDPTLGDGSIAELAARLTARSPSDPFASLLNSPVMDFAGRVPLLTLFVGNGMDGTSLHPNGFNGGFFIGNGGDGLNSTTPCVPGGNGGNGWLIGSGGKCGNGYSDIRTSGDATGTNGGQGGEGGIYGGSGGDGGTASGGVTNDPGNDGWKPTPGTPESSTANPAAAEYVQFSH